MKKPSVLVLMATYNGGKWLDEQIHTILNQNNVNISILAADDCSIDNTHEILERYAKNSPIKFYINKNNLGPSLNFFSLIIAAHLEGIDYIALSDQDDFWHPNKIAHAIKMIDANGYDGYSSGFYVENNILVNKNSKLTKYDYIFESSGPGCTFVLTSNSAKEFKQFLGKDLSFLNGVEFHDWLIYFWYRVNQKKWIIDNKSEIYYRQHNNNYMGANIGFLKNIIRIKMLINGWYIDQINLMIKICSNKHLEIDLLYRNKLSFIKIINIALNSRRDVFYRPIILIYLLMYRLKIIGR